MILYNVTVNVEPDVHQEWLQWMREEHIPRVMAAGKFVDHKLCRILNRDEEGPTYSVQYFAASMEAYEAYRDQYAPALQAEAMDKFRNKFVAFRTLLEVL